MSRLSLYALLLLTALTGTASAELRASLDNAQVSPGETVQLVLDHDGRSGTQPDLSPLQKDFDVLGRSTGTRVQIINGNVSSSTQLQLTLSPKHEGHLTIPPISWGPDHSTPLTLDVSANVGGTAENKENGDVGTSGNNRVFIETEVAPKQPYVQAGVDITVHVYSAVPLSQASLAFEDMDSALVRQVGSDTHTHAQRNGMAYNVITRHYRLFPQRSGALSVAGPTLTARMPVTRSATTHSWDPFSDLLSNSPFGDMLAAKKPIRLHAAAIDLNVRPRPAGAGASYWLPARSVSLRGSWQPNPARVHAGDPVTLDLDLQAHGLIAAQLPDLSKQLKLPDGVKAYPDQPELKDSADGNDIVGERRQRIALISDKPGDFHIPDLHLTWWNTQSDRPVEETLPGLTLSVSPASGSGIAIGSRAQTPVAESSAPVTPDPRILSTVSEHDSQGVSLRTWQWMSAAFAALWLITLVAWWRARRRRRAPTDSDTSTPSRAVRLQSVSASEARMAFRAACKANNASAARRHLLEWMNAVRRGHPIRGLNELADVLEDARLTPLLRDLDRACYASCEWCGDVLGKVALRELPLPDRDRATEDDGLAPLYR
jgi:hypothetical protein